MKSNFTCFSETFDYALGWTVIHSLWQAMAIAILMGIALIVLRKKTAKVRYWVANSALLMVLLSAITTFAYYYDISKEPPVVQFIPDTETISQKAGSPLAEIVNHKSEIQNSSLTLEGFKDYFNQHIPLIVLVWIMGVALFILKLLGGISYCYYLRSRLNFPADEYWMETLDKLKNKVGVKQSIELVESALTRTPMVVGLMKPMILFPIGAINKLSPTEVEAILAHEIAHVMRKDFIFNILQSVIEALFYYHPAVWVISSTIRNERENCCDDVAIEICGSSMDYAKALVTVQEMAYYPMYQPALAFAGNRKNQLLFRVQRILNQPQNKTNVMEKLIATCMLVVVMMGLSFGEKSFANNNFSENNTPSVSSTIEAPATPESPTVPVPSTATFYLYFPDKIDSLRVPEGIENGKYEYEDNTQSAELIVKNSYVVALKVNNINLNDEQLPNYKRLIDKILRSKQPNNEGQRAIVDNAMENAGISFQNDGMKMNNDRAKMSVDKNGLHLKGVDDKGQSFNLSVDENGFQMEAIGDDGKPVKMNLGKNATTERPQKNTTYINKGILTTFDEKGEKWVIKPEKDGIKYIEHFNTNDKLVETIKMQNGKVYINDREATTAELHQKGWEINAYGIQRIGGFRNIQPQDKYLSTNTFGTPEDIKSYRISLKNKYKVLIDRALALKRVKGIDVLPQINPTLNDARRDLNKNYATFDDLKNTERKLDWVETYIENKEDNDEVDPVGAADPIDENKDENKGDVKVMLKELRTEIKECDCETNIPFRENLVRRVNALLSKIESKNVDGFNAMKEYRKLQNEWEQGECDENKKSTGSVNSYGQNNVSISKNKNGYSYGTGDSYATAEKARADAEHQAKKAKEKSEDNGKSGKAIRGLFQTLINEGYISTGKKCEVAFNHNVLRVNDKRISGDLYDRIKADFEKTLGSKKTTYAINFAGVINSISNNNLDLEGTMNTSINND